MMIKDHSHSFTTYISAQCLRSLYVISENNFVAINLYVIKFCFGLIINISDSNFVALKFCFETINISEINFVAINLYVI